MPTAEADLDGLDSDVRVAAIRRMGWFRQNAKSVIHHRLQNLPDDLAGLCQHRSEAYRDL
ncbi:MAG: hypothetical protein FJ272_08390 [Planctomycetes bacterium]|nr:hypothetical protein [Planctomycetota bacterium]